ncbi:FAD-dependent oxidoreductase [Halalkalibacter oceani]|uniref:FAD-dependent oxidoreductase n=1 Tax=Halalkalibacter oceani TaxID=1653776 RepID=UPI003391DC65
MNYVIIGGDAAGMSAAMQIVRHDPTASVTTLEMGDDYSYAQCGLPYLIGGLIDDPDQLVARTVETFRRKYKIDARTRHEVTGIDPTARRVFGEHFDLTYDKLLIATGARPFLPSWEGKSLDGVHTLKTIPDARRLLRELKQDVDNVVIIGGGYIGLEMAENFAARGKQVTIVERNSQLATIFDPDLAEHIHAEAEKNGIKLVFDQEVQALGGTKRVEEVVTDKQTLPADLVLIAIGVRPNTDFVKGSGIELSENGAIKVNAFMETNLASIYAAGDCATQYHRIKERDDYIPLGTHANKQGRIAGINMSGRPRSFKGIVGTSIVKFFSLTLGRTGLSKREAEQHGIPYQAVTAELPQHASYYPGAEKLLIRLLYQPNTGQLLGAQLFGRDGVDKRLDVLATALYHGMTMQELEDLDLAYAPPYNGVWDPVQQTARRK